MSENEGRPPEEQSEGEPPTKPFGEAEATAEAAPAAPPGPDAPAPVAAAPAAATAAVTAPPQWDATVGAPTGTGYPVGVGVPPDEGQNRLWGIPFVGLIIRAILVIPQVIVLWVLAIVTGFLVLVSWAPILINGRQASFVYTVIGGYLRLAARVNLYVALVTGRYPPFGPGGEHTISVTFDETEQQNRLWGIPFVGLWVRLIILIPHYIVLSLIGIVVAFMFLVSWAPVLFTGRQADVIAQWMGGFNRWAVRVGAYSLLLTGKYPPFRLDD